MNDLYKIWLGTIIQASLTPIVILSAAIMLSGCFWNTKPDPCIPITKEVYKYPEFTMPLRPQLQEIPTVASDGLAVRIMESNMNDLMNYTEQLETTLNKFKK